MNTAGEIESRHASVSVKKGGSVSEDVVRYSAEKARASGMCLDVGCGKYKIAGAVGIDRFALPGVDVMHDLDRYPWPFDDNTFDRIVCNHSISHLGDFVRAVEELHRIAKPGATVEIVAPHYAGDNCNTDPTIKTRLGVRSMNYFCEQYSFKYHYYSAARFFMIKRSVSFRENATDFRASLQLNPFRWVGIETLVNWFPRIYERFFVYWLPVSEVYYKLRVIKGGDADGS